MDREVFWWWLVGAKGIPRWEKDSGGGGGFDGWDRGLKTRVRPNIYSQWIFVRG